MTRTIHAELIRLLRPRTYAALAGAAALFAAVSAFSIFATADATAVESRRSAVNLSLLTGTGGGTQAFAVGASFVGFFVFVTIIALMASEFSGGTFRALALREPRRMRVIAGKLAGILMVAAGALVAAEVLTFLASMALAPFYDISTSAWFSLSSLGSAADDAVTVFAGVVGWAIFGTLLAVAFRSAPVALGVGFAWAGPFENIVSGSWSPGYRFFPGQVLASLIRGGTVELGFGRAALTATVYAAVAAAAALTLVHRRDVTA